MTSRQMKLGAFMYPGGHHVAAWRHPDVSASATTDFAYRARFAQTAERVGIESLWTLGMTWPGKMFEVHRMSGEQHGHAVGRYLPAAESELPFHP